MAGFEQTETVPAEDTCASELWKPAQMPRLEGSRGSVRNETSPGRFTPVPRRRSRVLNDMNPFSSRFLVRFCRAYLSLRITEPLLLYLYPGFLQVMLDLATQSRFMTAVAHRRDDAFGIRTRRSVLCSPVFVPFQSTPRKSRSACSPEKFHPEHLGRSSSAGRSLS